MKWPGWWLAGQVLAGLLAAAASLIAVLGFFGIATIADVPNVPPGLAFAVLAALLAAALAANVWLLRRRGEPTRGVHGGEPDQSRELDLIATLMREAMVFLEQMWSMRAPVRADAEKKAAQAEQYAYRLRDTAARELVLEWKASWDYVAKDGSGWVSSEAIDLQRAHRNAQERIGALLAGTGAAGEPQTDRNTLKK